MNLKNVLLFVENTDSVIHQKHNINLFINEEWKMAPILKKNMIQQKIKKWKETPKLKNGEPITAPSYQSYREDVYKSRILKSKK
jgi:hypothetical protein